MKNLFVFIMLFIIGSSTIKGQACFPDGITFDSQSAIDDFAINNPDCHRIAGDLTISGSCNQLNGLSSIDSIYGRLYVHNSVLTTLAGLEQLKYVHKGIKIIGNYQLVDISALSGIDPEGFISSYPYPPYLIQIKNNQSLTSCNIETVCQEISTHPEWVDINNNGGSGCNSISGTGCINYAPGDCLIEGITFNAQSELDSFVLKTGCKNIFGSVHVKSNITNLEGLLGLKSIGGDLLVRDAPLNSLAGLDSLHHIGGSLELTRLPILDLQGLSHLEGVETLEIGACDSLVNLEGLGSLRKVGSLKIGGRTPYWYLNNKNLLTLDGLTSIDSIGKLALVKSDTLQNLKGLSHLTKLNDLEIGSNYSLKNFEGLENITSLSGNLYLGVGMGFGMGQNYHYGITGNGITSFKGLEQLTHIGGNFHIQNTNKLLNFNYLDNLEEISGNFIVGDFYEFYPWQYLTWEDNLELSSFSGLGKLKKVGGKFKLYGTNKVVDFSGISLLDSIGGDFNLASSNLLSLNGLSPTLHIGGSINLGMPDWTLPLTDLSLLNVSDTIHGDLTMIGLDSIKNLDKFLNLKLVEGDLQILNMNELTTLNGLNNLTTVNGRLEVGKIYRHIAPTSEHPDPLFLGNSKLTSLEGLENLLDVKESLTIAGNPMLTSLSSLNPNLQVGKNISIGSMRKGSEYYTFETFGNDLLVDLTGFPKQAAINGSLTIAGNQSLETLAELSSLTKIEDDLFFVGNNSLTDLSGLDSLTEVRGLFIGKVTGDTIVGNSSLTSLSGIENLTIKEELSIAGNEQLSICNILSVCKVLDTLPNIIIQDNADGCNAANELECDNTVGISELESSSIHISPNPANNYIYLTSTIKPAPDNVLIYNQLGQVILAEKYESKLDISALIPGIYFVEVHHKKGIMRGKLVVE